MQHYAQTTEADLQEAAKMTLIGDAEKRVQNPVLTTAESSSTESHESNTGDDLSPYFCEGKHQKTKACESVRNAGHWALEDSNLGPMDYESTALTN